MHFLEDFGKRHGKTTGPGSSETFGPFGPPYLHSRILKTRAKALGVLGIVATTPDILFSLLPSIVKSRKGDYNSKSFLLKYHICVWSSVKNSSTFKTFT